MIYRHQRKLTRFIRAIYKGFRDKTGILETICQFRCKGTTPSDDDDSSKKNYNYITKQHLYPTYMQYIANLDVNSPVLNYTKKAGIICTVGPSSKSVEILEQMMDAGMDIARLNFSHGTHEYHKESISNIREAVKRRSKRYGIPLPIGIALDTKGPEVRTGQFPKGEKDEVLIKKGDTLTLHTDESYYHKGSASDIYIDLPSMPSSVRPGTSIFIDDGLIHLKVVDTGTTTITCLIENGGLLGSRKGVNVPGVKLNLPSISDQDKDDICFGVEQGIDIIFASFIRRREDIFHIRRLLSACASKGEKGNDIQIIAKIENHEGVDNFDEIMESSDGIMVARGDLGIEINSERVFLAQKRMIASCNLAGKPVICATQMLESMTKKPRPTRAESSDVANAILDGADCVMLSGETAKGDYPVECVHVMADICKVSEEAVQHMKVFQEVIRVTPSPTNKTNAVAIAAVAAANKTLAEGILVITSTGYSAHVVSKFRPPCNIYAITTSESVARKCYLHRGVIPVLHTHEVPDEWSVDTELRILSGLKKGLMMKYIHKGDMVVVLTGWKKGRGNTSTMRILYVDDTIYKTVLAHVN